MSLGARIVIIVALQTIALVAMVGMKQYTLSTGTPVVLKTAPIDPRSLFSGDYVRLNYSISRLQPEQLAGDRVFASNDPIYVVVQPAGEYWEPVSLHHHQPAPGEGQVAIKGRVLSVSERTWNRQLRRSETVHSINIKYGVENYYVPEGEGRALERPQPGETVSIRLVVDQYGNAAIQAVLVNGAERYVEKVF